MNFVEFPRCCRKTPGRTVHDKRHRQGRPQRCGSDGQILGMRQIAKDQNQSLLTLTNYCFMLFPFLLSIVSASAANFKKSWRVLPHLHEGLTCLEAKHIRSSLPSFRPKAFKRNQSHYSNYIQSLFCKPIHNFIAVDPWFGKPIHSTCEAKPSVAHLQTNRLDTTLPQQLVRGVVNSTSDAIKSSVTRHHLVDASVQKTTTRIITSIVTSICTYENDMGKSKKLVVLGTWNITVVFLSETLQGEVSSWQNDIKCILYTHTHTHTLLTVPWSPRLTKQLQQFFLQDGRKEALG